MLIMRTTTKGVVDNNNVRRKVMLIKLTVEWKDREASAEQIGYLSHLINIARTANKRLYKNIHTKDPWVFIFNPLCTSSGNSIHEIVRDLIQQIFNFPDEQIMDSEHSDYIVSVSRLTPHELEQYYKD